MGQLTERERGGMDEQASVTPVAIPATLRVGSPPLRPQGNIMVIVTPPSRHGLDIEQLLARALDEPTALDILIHITELMHFTVELQHRLSPYRAAAIKFLLDDDRSNRWIAKQIGVTHQVIDRSAKRHEGQELPTLEPRFGASM